MAPPAEPAVVLDHEKTMPLAHRITLALLAALPMAAVAEDDIRPPHPADPAAHAPAPVYRSAFNGYRRLSEFQESPDKIWRTVNDEVGRLGGHAGHTATSAPAGSHDIHRRHEEE